MANPPKRLIAAILAGSLFGTCLAGPAFAFDSVTFSFVAAGDAQAPVVLPDTLLPDGDAVEAPSVEDGAVLSAAEVLDMVSAAPAPETSASPMFTDALLIAAVQGSDGSIRQYAIAECATLDFTSSGLEQFEQQVICDDRLFGYESDAAGIAVTLDGEPFTVVTLAPGPYLINGVPAVVTDQ